jgi:hypothetical protein
MDKKEKRGYQEYIISAQKTKAKKRKKKKGMSL